MTTFTQDDFDLLQAMLMHDNIDHVYEALDYLQAMKAPIELWWALIELEPIETFEDWASWLAQEEDILPHHRILATTLLGVLTEQRPDITTGVTHLSLMGCSLFTLPKWVSQFKRLQVLNVAYNPLTELDSSIVDLPLVNLTLAHCSLTALPEYIGDVSTLRVLHCGHNQLTSIAESIFQLEQLEILSLHDNNLTELPEQWAFQRVLTHFDGTLNPIGRVPSALEDCDTLEVLIMNGCNISEVPNWIGGLQSLTFASFGGNPLRCIPDSIGHLTNLQTLALWDCMLTEVPSSLGRLPLQELDLSYNELSLLPNTLEDCSPQRLVLHGNPLSDLPVGLKRVCLDGSQVEAIHERMKSYSQLEYLDLSDRDLTMVPESICELSQLQELILSDNQLTELPEWLCDLTQLKNLNVWLNPLESLPTGLSSICLSYDQFEQFESELLAMKTLKHFGLIDNTLIFVPEMIAELTQIESLNLEGNDIVQLPSWLGEMPFLGSIKVSGNPLSNDEIETFRHQFRHINLY